MSELHKFLFDGLPVRGALVRLTDDWQAILRRRAANTQTGAWPPAVAALVGEMTAASVLMQNNIAFEGALVLQIFGDGPVKVAVAEVRSDRPEESPADAPPGLRFRATATVTAANSDAIAPDTPLSALVNAQGRGRCAITLDPARRLPGQQPYQGIVPLADGHGRKLESMAAIIGHYMRQSEQLDTALVLAADDRAACGLMIQRLPVQGQNNLAQSHVAQDQEDDDFRRIALLAQSLRREELLTQDADAILHRLFWQEKLARYAPLTGPHGPRFACTCSRGRMAAMLRGLGADEVQDVLRERGLVEVGCDFCGHQEHFDAVDVARLFTPAQALGGGSQAVQ